MLDGLLAAASGMEAQQRQLDAVSNDLANESTPGYQSELLGFHDLLYTTAGPGQASLAPTGDGSEAWLVGRSQELGQIHQTGRPLDVALQGDGYLEVTRPDGTIGLTRNGALGLTADRRLVTGEGLPVLPGATIPNGIPLQSVRIAPDGTVQANGRTLGRLNIVSVPARDKLLAVGQSMFTATAASGAIRSAAGTTIQQGALEDSNVDMAQAMTKMMDAQRSYQMDSRAIQMQDQMMQIANQLKR